MHKLSLNLLAFNCTAEEIYLLFDTEDDFITGLSFRFVSFLIICYYHLA